MATSDLFFRKKTALPKARQIFAHSTEDAIVRAIKFRGKNCIVRVPKIRYTLSLNRKTKKVAQKEFQKQSVFHALYPENSLNPLGIAEVEIDGKRMWGSVSEIGSPRDPRDARVFGNRLQQQNARASVFENASNRGKRKKIQTGTD
ncbi:MAG: hypothetical protein V1847_04530 [Candidatus Diapherotrites archaeon]